jgi:aspartate/methionine/tyrosine aminotransferase
MKLISRTLNQVESPMDNIYALAAQYEGNLSLLDLAQGVTNYATAPVIANHIAKVACDPDGGKYTSRAGIEQLRNIVARELSNEYAGKVTSENVLITAGCNQAFCIAVSALADFEDEIILPVPYYFNHKMWLQMEHITPVYLSTAPNFIPNPEYAESLITDKTKGIVLVTPGNPTGSTINPSIIHKFAELATKYDIMLILDETYKVFRTFDEPPHELFAKNGWSNNIVSLQSFSKEFAIPGHRVGAAIAHPDLITEMMKLFSCMAICAPRLGQEAVIAALTKAKNWRQDRVMEIHAKQAQFETVFLNKPGGFELCSSGAFFGWVRHPITNKCTDYVLRKLLFDHGILSLPGTIFAPSDEHYLRFSYANLSLDDIADLGLRLREFS